MSETKEPQTEAQMPNVLSRKEYEKRYKRLHKDTINEQTKTRNRRLRKKIAKILGDTCVVCGKKTKNRNLCSHEKYGNAHSNNPDYILNHINDFIPLCHACHRAVHQLSKYPSLSEYTFGDNNE